MKESYIKLPNITVSKLQDVIDYLDENNIEYIEEYKRDKEINRLNNIINRTIKYVESLSSSGRGCDIYEDIKKEILNELKGDE